MDGGERQTKVIVLEPRALLVQVQDVDPERIKLGKVMAADLC